MLRKCRDKFVLAFLALGDLLGYSAYNVYVGLLSCVVVTTLLF